MNRELFHRLLEDTSHVPEDSMATLEELTREFPFCSVAQILLAKAYHKRQSMFATQRLRLAAAYSPDRAHLREFVEAKEHPQIGPSVAEEVDRNINVEALKPPVEETPTPVTKPAPEKKEEAPVVVQTPVPTPTPEPEPTPAPVASKEPPVVEKKAPVAPTPLPKPAPDSDIRIELAERMAQWEKNRHLMSEFLETTYEIESMPAVTPTDKKASKPKEEVKPTPAAETQPEKKESEPSTKAAPEKKAEPLSLEEAVQKAISKDIIEKIDVKPKKDLKPKSTPDPETKTEKAARSASNEPTASSARDTNPFEWVAETIAEERKPAASKPIRGLGDARRIPLAPQHLDSTRLGAVILEPDLKEEHPLLGYLRRHPSGSQRQRLSREEQNALIEQFISQGGAPRPAPSLEQDAGPTVDLADPSSSRPRRVSEHLARLYAKQGKLGQAISIYEHLALDFPSKSGYFAAQAAALRNQLSAK